MGKKNIREMVKSVMESYKDFKDLNVNVGDPVTVNNPSSGKHNKKGRVSSINKNGSHFVKFSGEPGEFEFTRNELTFG